VPSRRVFAVVAALTLVAALAPAATAAADPAAGYDAAWTVTRPDLTQRTDGRIAVGDDLSLVFKAVDGTPATDCKIRITARGGSMMETPGLIANGECRLTIRLPDFPDPGDRSWIPPDDAALDICVWPPYVNFADGQTRHLRAEDDAQPGGRECNNFAGSGGPQFARLDFRFDPTGTPRPFQSTPQVLSWNPADWGTGMQPLRFGQPWHVELPDWAARCWTYLNGEWQTVIRPAIGAGCETWDVRVPGVLPSTLPWVADGSSSFYFELFAEYHLDETGPGGMTLSQMHVPLAASDGVFESSRTAIFPVDLATTRFVPAGEPWTPVYQVDGATPLSCNLKLYTVPPTWPEGTIDEEDFPGTVDDQGRCGFTVPAMEANEFHQYYVTATFAEPIDPNLSFGGSISAVPPPEPPVIDPPVEEPDGETGIGVEPGDGLGLVVDVEVVPNDATGSLAGTAAECTDRAVSPNLETGGDIPRLSTSCGLAPGQYTVNARMVDASGVITTAARSITVLAPRPAIAARTPAPNQTGVARNIRPTVTFTQPVSGVSASSFRLRDVAAGTWVPATVTYDAATRKATLRPSALLGAGRTYRLYLTSAIKNASGRSLLYTYWSFKVTTDATRPTFTRSPASGATGVSRYANVVLTFSEPVVGATSSRIRLRDAATGTYVTATVTYYPDLRKAVLNPSVTLRGLRRYTVVVSSGMTDRAGNPLYPSPTTWSFTTRP
jgi:hypothetical protein